MSKTERLPPEGLPPEAGMTVTPQVRRLLAALDESEADGALTVQATDLIWLLMEYARLDGYVMGQQKRKEEENGG